MSEMPEEIWVSTFGSDFDGEAVAVEEKLKTGWGTPYILKSRHTALEKAAEGMRRSLILAQMAIKQHIPDVSITERSPPLLDTIDQALQQYQQYKGENGE